MVITFLDAQVAPDKAPMLESAYKQGIQQLDKGIAQTFLLRGVREPDVWRIVTVWESRAALDEMRASGETPRGVLMFRTADADPKLTVFEVVADAASIHL